ncbi:hypothetical protein BGX38DRAFT_1095677, partial [Terfezia claveryi]
RIFVLVVTGIVAAGCIILLRALSSVPFFPTKDHRSNKIVNKKDFLYLYSEDELPSKAPVEPLNSSRLGWAYATAAALIGLLVMTSMQLASRVLNGLPFHEETTELSLYSFLTLLWGLRFCATPYRHTIFLTVALSSIIPTLIGAERDIWPKLLFHPNPSQLTEIRDGGEVRVCLGLTLLLSFILTPRVWYPVDPYDEKAVASPEQTASFASYILSYSWIGGLVLKALHKDIHPEDLPPIPDYDRGKLWAQKILKNQKKSTLRTLVSLMRYDLCFMIMASFSIGASKFISPFAMRQLLAYIERSQEPTITPWVWVALLFVGPIASASCFEFYVFNSTRLIVRVKAALTQSLLLKTMKISFTSAVSNKKEDASTAVRDESKEGTKKAFTSPEHSKVGMINNLMSTDLEQLTEARYFRVFNILDFFLLIGSAPIELIFAVWFLYDLLGWSSLVGVALMLLSMAVPGITAKILARIQIKSRKATDARIGVTTEALNSIRIIKFFGLENAFLGRIREKRELELRYAIHSRIWSLFFHCLTSLLPVMNMLVTFAIYTNIMKKPLSASVTFTAISLFGWLGFVTKALLYAGVSFQRIDKFLHEEEEIESIHSPQGYSEGSSTATSGMLGYKNATLLWSKPGSEDDNHFRLSALNVECAPGGLTIVSGPVGSGKSSFLLGLLGEMRLLEGQICLPRDQGVAYVSQTPWLQNATIRDNILFGSEYDEKRYKAVLQACALAADIEMFAMNDLTEVGERGVTLSGGQKARLALARAVYSPTKIVLLDDVLSALDAGTIKTVVQKCITGEVLRDRTVVLVTHHVSLVAASAHQIVVLNDGSLVSAGPPALFPDLLSSDKTENIEVAEAEVITRMAAESLALNGVSHDLTVPTMQDKTSSRKGKLVLEEERAVGRVPKKLVMEYLQQMGGPFMLLLLIASCIAMELVSLSISFFVGLWSDAYRHPEEVNVNRWLAGYAAIICLNSLVTGFTFGISYWAQWIAARIFHEKLVKAILFAPVRFFDTTPIGRIINRFSKDVKSIDESLGSYLQITFVCVLEVSMLMIILSGLVPVFLIPTILVCILGFAVGEMYVRAQMAVKRIVSVKESPLISHFNDTIQGVITIRAFSCQQRFLNENLKRIDDYTLPQQTLYNLNRWLGVRINGLTAIVGVSAGAIALTSTHLPAGLLGFSLVNALGFSGTILYTVRYFNNVEVELNSLERVNEYLQLKQETPATTENQPPASWPTEGDLKVRDLSPRERVGVVGRTGAGKSSLALSLLRFTERSGGSITINGRDIEKVNLDSLRQRITIIPQDPVLFSGTIRSNLDPFGDIDDSELQWALEGSGLIGTNSGTDRSGTKKLTLDTRVTSGGDNLSQGQRQLLAFARALVRRSKLVILDEATSSTDHKMDERIQRTLKTSFPDSSILCIAHRLRTVMTFDKILVLENKGNGGEIVEYDTPANLLQKEGGALYTLAKRSGEFNELLSLATTV